MEKDEIELSTNAINTHGVLFKRAVLRALIESGINIIADEYPVNYLNGTSIDIVAGVQGKVIITIECKKVYGKVKCFRHGYKGFERKRKVFPVQSGSALFSK